MYRPSLFAYDAVKLFMNRNTLDPRLFVKIIELTQKSEAWIDWRRGGITASEISLLVEESPYRNLSQLLRAKSAPFSESNRTNEDMERGILFEPLVRKALEGIYGALPAVCVESSEFEWVRASLDGLQHTPTYTRILEIKCPRDYNHDRVLRGEVPITHLLQMQWQLLCVRTCPAPHVLYVSYCHEHECKLHVMRIEPDRALQESMLNQAKEAWESIRQGRKPKPKRRERKG
jgi:putative phage-type endonuclease